MTDVETIELRPEGQSPRPRLALIVAMTVIAVVAGGFLVTRKSLVASPVSVATEFMDALAEHDGDTALELFSPDGTFDDKYPSNLPIVAEWDRAVGWLETNQGCEEISTSAAGTLVACPFIRQTDWILALGLEPVTNNIYEILVAKGQIQSVVETDNGEVSRDGMIEASVTFQSWVRASHPDDYATMYGSGGQWLIDPAAIALYEKYTDEFVSYMASPESVARAFMGALNTHDGNAALELLAEDARYKGLSPLSDLPLALDLDRAIGEHFTIQGCEEVSTDANGTLVDCRFIVESDVSRALGIEPVSVIYTIRVDEGHIQTVDATCCEDVPGVEDPWITFRNWVKENHPDDMATMYFGEGGAHLNPESIALFEQYTDEFVASLEA